jgi:hypothetical protein
MIDKFLNAFSDIQFSSDTHTYRVKNYSDPFISVTTLIDVYCHQFDSDSIATKTAKKRKIDKKDLLDEWEHKKNASIDKGKYIHSFIENRIKIQNYEDNTNLYPKEKSQFLDFENNFLKDKTVLYSEKVLYNSENRLAGTIDCLVYDDKDKKLYYIDWKTNEKISFTNKYKNLKFPLNKYQQSSKEIYALQLSFYRYMIETEIIDKDESLSSLLNNSSNYVVQINEANQTYNMIELPYYKYSVNQTLKHYNKENKI